MAEDAIPGPSATKKPRIRNPKKLSDEELLQLAYSSDNSDCEPFEDSGSEWSGADDVLQSAGNSDAAESEAESDDANNDGLDNPSSDIWTTIPDLKNINFTGIQELKVPVPGQGMPIDFFYLLCDDDFFDMLVQQTNIYAEHIFLTQDIGPYSRISRWKEVSKTEMRVFIAITFYMGVVQLPRIRDYWKTSRMFNFPTRNYMSRDRYLIILRCLHFAQNPVDARNVPNDRLFKIRPMMDFFNQKMLQIYAPGKNLSLDESMLLWRGRLIFRQYIKNKKHKYGIKFYLLTESNGIILKLQIYTGAFGDLGGKGHAEKVVLNLVENYIGNGYSVYMDNYYNSVSLARKLLDKGIYCTGTLRAGRKDTPKDVSNAKLKKDECVYRYEGNVCVGKWKDKRDVLYITTEHQHQLEEVTSNSGNIKIKPTPIIQYNRFMSGIDLQDQMLAYYPSHRKTIRWYKKVGLHICEMMLHNSFKLYSKYSTPKMSFLDFRMSVIEAMLPDEQNKENKKAQTPHHLPSKYEVGESKKKMRKRCRWCFKRGIRKDSAFICNACPDSPGLCLDPCFQEFHANL